MLLNLLIANYPDHLICVHTLQNSCLHSTIAFKCLDQSILNDSFFYDIASRDNFQTKDFQRRILITINISGIVLG